MNAERPTFKQVQDQHEVGHGEATVLVRRGDGRVHVGRVDYSGQGRDSYNVEMVDDEGGISYKPVAAEALSDKSQETLARELGGPLRGEEEKRILAEYNDLVAGLSEDDKTALWRFVKALYPHEISSAREKMSDSLQQNPQLITKAREIYRRLKEAREAIRE